MAVWSETSKFEITSFKRVDAEFFWPEYMKAEERVRSIQHSNLSAFGSFVPGPFGGAFHVKNYDSKSQYRYVRGKDVKPFILLNDDNVYLPKEDFLRLNKYSLQVDDLLVSVVGTLGNISIVESSTIPAIFSCKSTVFRSTSNINPYFLLTYLNSKYGKHCLLRRQRGAIQTGLNIEDLQSIPIPCLSEDLIAEISSSTQRAIDLFNKSKELYTQAQQLLESELGLDKLEFEKPVGYEVSFSEVVDNNRSDAEFYHVRYDSYLNKALTYKNGYFPLSHLTTRVYPNFDACKHTEEFDYIEIGDVSISDGSYKKQRVKAKNLPANAKIKLNGGEIVLSQVRPIRGAISIIEDEILHPTICSGAFYTCRTNEQEYREIIWLYLRCMRAVFEKYCGGTSYPTIKSYYLSNFPVPNFDKKISKQIKGLVVQSKQAKHESKKLLEQAKHRVEQLIEEAGKNEPDYGR